MSERRAGAHIGFSKCDTILNWTHMGFPSAYVINTVLNWTEHCFLSFDYKDWGCISSKVMPEKRPSYCLSVQQQVMSSYKLYRYLGLYTVFLVYTVMCDFIFWLFSLNVVQKYGGLNTPFGSITPIGSATDIDMKKIGQARNTLMDIKLTQVATCLLTDLVRICLAF